MLSSDLVFQINCPEYLQNFALLNLHLTCTYTFKDVLFADAKAFSTVINITLLCMHKYCGFSILIDLAGSKIALLWRATKKWWTWNRIIWSGPGGANLSHNYNHINLVKTLSGRIIDLVDRNTLQADVFQKKGPKLDRKISRLISYKFPMNQSKKEDRSGKSSNYGTENTQLVKTSRFSGVFETWFNYKIMKKKQEYSEAIKMEKGFEIIFSFNQEYRVIYGSSRVCEKFDGT